MANVPAVGSSPQRFANPKLEKLYGVGQRTQQLDLTPRQGIGIIQGEEKQCRQEASPYSITQADITFMIIEHFDRHLPALAERQQEDVAPLRDAIREIMAGGAAEFNDAIKRIFRGILQEALLGSEEEIREAIQGIVHECFERERAALIERGPGEAAQHADVQPFRGLPQANAFQQVIGGGAPEFEAYIENLVQRKIERSMRVRAKNEAEENAQELIKINELLKRAIKLFDEPGGNAIQVQALAAKILEEAKELDPTNPQVAAIQRLALVNYDKNIKKPIPLPKTVIVEGETYELRHLTRGDGACLIHALMANGIIDNFWTYSEEGKEVQAGAKELFLNRIIRLFVSDSPDPFLLNLIADCVKESFGENENRVVDSFYIENNQVKARLADFYYSLVINNEVDQPLLAILLGEIRDVSKDEQFLKDLEQDKEKCSQAFENVWEKFRDNWLVTRAQKLETYNSLRVEKERTFQEAEERKRSYFLNQERFGKYYRSVVVPSYFLSDREAELAAHLFDKKVIMRSSQEGENRMYNSNGSETVVVYHAGSHYSRYTLKTEL